MYEFWQFWTCWQLHLSLHVGECFDGMCKPADTTSCFPIQSCSVMTRWKRLTGKQQAIKPNYPQARVSWLCLLFMMTRWHSWTSSQLLQLLLSYNHLPQKCQLQSIIYSMQLPIGHLIFFPQTKQRKGGGERETCVLSFSRIKMPQKWKMKETNTTECQSII